MKKVLAVLAVLAICMASVMATDMDLTPQNTNMPVTGEKDVTVCVTTVAREGQPALPVSGLALSITRVCKDTNHNTYCDKNDASADASGFSVTVKTSPTDSNGCGVVTLHTADADIADYAYQVSGLDAGDVVVAENGSTYIPEFTAIGAGIALVGAGIIAARRRKE